MVIPPQRSATSEPMNETPDRVYPIKHHGDELCAGRSANQQVLIAPAGFGVAALFFDANGILIETKQRRSTESIPGYDYARWERALREQMDRYAHEIDFTPQTIHVRRFEAREVG